MNQLETVAWLKGADGWHVQVPVTVCFELDGYRPINLCVEDERGNVITGALDKSEYYLLVEKATRHAVEYMTESAETNCEGER